MAENCLCFEQIDVAFWLRYYVELFPCYLKTIFRIAIFCVFEYFQESVVFVEDQGSHFEFQREISKHLEHYVSPSQFLNLLNYA